MKKKVKEAIKLRRPNILTSDLDKICNDFEKVEKGFLYLIEDLMTHEGSYVIVEGSTLEDVAIYLFKLSLENLDLFIHCLIQKEGNEYHSIPVANINMAATEVRRGAKKL